MFRYKTWISLVVFLVGFPICGMTQQQMEQPAANPVASPLPPEIKQVQSPAKSHYSVGESINYRLVVHLPSGSEGFRMDSPDLELENLELIGVNQEASEANEQILNFRFSAKTPGIAKIKHFLLRWIYGAGTLTSEYKIPPAEFKISAPSPSFKFLIAALIGIFFALSILVAFMIKKKKKPVPVRFSVEEAMLEELKSIYSEFQNTGAPQKSLGKMRHIFEEYLKQKLDWNPARLNYNELQKKLGEKWSSKEANEVEELIRAMEYQQYSGSEIEQNKFVTIYQTVYSLIERRKSI